MLLSQQAKKWLTVLKAIIAPYYEGEIELFLHHGGKKCIWSKGDLLGHLLVLPYSVLKVNGKVKKTLQEWRYGLLLLKKSQNLVKDLLRVKEIQNE